MPLLPILDQRGVLREDAAAIVFATMLHPGPDESGDRADYLAWRCFERQQNGLVAKVPEPDLFRVAKRGRDNIARRVQRHHKLGMRTGHLIWSLLKLWGNVPDSASLNSASAMTAALIRTKPPPDKLEERGYRRLRPAAHLWAAAHYAETEDYRSHDWPNDTEAFARLLWVAEGVRDALENLIRPRNTRARAPLLPAGIAWRVPDQVLVVLVRRFGGLPEFVVPPMQDSERKAIQALRAENRQPEK